MPTVKFRYAKFPILLLVGGTIIFLVLATFWTDRNLRRQTIGWDDQLLFGVVSSKTTASSSKSGSNNSNTSSFVTPPPKLEKKKKDDSREEEETADSIILIPSQNFEIMVTMAHQLSSWLSNTTNIPMEYRKEAAPCHPTVQVRLKYTEPYWTLQSIDEFGRAKTVGGDEYYVTYHDKNNNNTGDPSAVAILQDRRNGEYVLEFFIPPMTVEKPEKLGHEFGGDGKLTVHFQYTCGMGLVQRPDKDHWKNNGSIHQTYARYSVPVPPNIRPFRPPPPPPEGSIVLPNYERVICFGDSIINNLCGMYWDTFSYRKSNIECLGNAGSPLLTETLQEKFIDKLDEWHGAQLRNDHDGDGDVPVSTALVLGSAAWDILENQIPDFDFRNHLQACRRFLEAIKDKYPHVTIYWKLPSAFHVHAIGDNCYADGNKQGAQCTHITKYLSTSLAYNLYEKQKQLMTTMIEENIVGGVLDLWNATYLSAGWLMHGDGRHYRRWLNELMLNYYYPGHKLPP